MTVLPLLKAELRRSFGVILGISAVLALTLALTVSAGLCERSLRQASTAAAERFDILIGARTGGVPLLLGTVFLRDEQLSLVPASVLGELRRDRGVRWAAPVAFGDRAGNAVIVGTTKDLASFGGTLMPEKGRLFEARDEALAGADSGFAPGDLITPSHGRISGRGHSHGAHRLKVVGTLPRTGTPWDRAVLIPIETVWAMHSPVHGTHGRDEPRLESWMNEDPVGLPGFSAVVVKPVGLSDAYRIRQRIGSESPAGADGRPVSLTAVFTGEVLVELYAALGNAGSVLSAFCQTATAAALLATLVTGILLGRLRRPMLLQLRVMGAPARYVFTLIWCLVMSVTVLGAAGGFALGWAGALIASAAVGAETGMRMIPTPGLPEVLITGCVLLSGALCALLPAAAAAKARLH